MNRIQTATYPARVLRGPRKLILRHHLSPGDVVMLAYAVKALHEQYPGQYLTDVDTSCNEIFEGNPFITPLTPGAPGVELLEMHYPTIHRSNQHPYHFVNSFVHQLGNMLGIRLEPTAFQGAIYLREEEKWWFSAVYERLGRDVPYWVVNAGYKNDFTAKAWDHSRYQAIVDRFPQITFVQVGHPDHNHSPLRGENVIQLVGQTDARQLIRLVYHSFGVITPVSWPMVLAYAVPPHPRFGRRSRACIVIAGGREPNHWQQGPNQQFLHTCGMLDCCDQGGCWRSRVAPLGDGDAKDRDLCHYPVTLANGQTIAKCMDLITADDAARLLSRYMDNLAAADRPAQPLPTECDNS